MSGGEVMSDRPDPALEGPEHAIPDDPRMHPQRLGDPHHCWPSLSPPHGTTVVPASRRKYTQTTPIRPVFERAVAMREHWGATEWFREPLPTEKRAHVETSDP